MPSCSIIGKSGVKAKRPMPMAMASDAMPANAMAHGWVEPLVAGSVVGTVGAATGSKGMAFMLHPI